MPFTRFTTNRRLWIVFSSLLFVVPWFVPLIGKMEEMTMIVYPLGVLTGPNRGDALAGTGVGILLFGVPALFIGWVLQGVVVMFAQRKEKADHSSPR